MKKGFFAVSLTIIFHIFLLSILQFTAWPEMINFPYLINHGFTAYKDMVLAYPPLLVNILALLYKVFGYNVWVLKMFGLTTFLVSDVLIYLILNKLIKKNNIAIVGVFIYAILQSVLDGNMVWPDLILIPFVLTGLLLILNKKYFLSGVALALAVLVKQTGIFYLGFAGIYIFFLDKKVRDAFNFIFGSLIVFALLLFNLISNNSFLDFMNWVIIYPSKYWTKFPGYIQLRPSLREDLVLFVLFIPILVLAIKLRKKITIDKYFLILMGFLICGVIGVYPRFSFFHFQPALSILVVIYVYLFSKTKTKVYFLLLIPFVVLVSNFKNLQYESVRFWNNGDLFLAKQIERETKKGAPIYLLGLNSNLYAFSDRFPNKPWVDNFGWYLEIAGVQESVVRSFESDPPQAVYWRTADSGNWYDIGAYQPKMITDWILKNYKKKIEIQKGIWEWVRK